MDERNASIIQSQKIRPLHPGEQGKYNDPFCLAKTNILPPWGARAPPQRSNCFGMLAGKTPLRKFHLVKSQAVKCFHSKP